jgi:recombination protein RecA
VSKNLEKIKNLVKKINKGAKHPIIQFASDTIDKFGFLSTPFTTLNRLCRGIPIGRFTIIAGASQVGKSAMCLQIIAHLQREDPEFLAVWVDFENSWDPDWAQTLGVDLERVVLLSYGEGTENMEAVLDKLMAVVGTQCAGLVVIDSIGGMTPKKDIQDKEGVRSLEKSNMLNLQTKLGEVYRIFNIKIAPRGDFRGTAVIMLGHVYQVPNDQGYTITEVRGGNAVKHWGYIRLAMKRGPKADWPKAIKVTGLDGKEHPVYPGFSGRVMLEKTKANQNEGQEIALGFYHGRGFDHIQSTISAALGLGIIDRSGGWYKSDLFPGEKVQGREAVDSFFMTDELAYKKLTELVDTSAATMQPTEEDNESQHH